MKLNCRHTYIICSDDSTLGIRTSERRETEIVFLSIKLLCSNELESKSPTKVIWILYYYYYLFRFFECPFSLSCLLVILYAATSIAIVAIPAHIAIGSNLDSMASELTHPSPA